MSLCSHLLLELHPQGRAADTVKGAEGVCGPTDGVAGLVQLTQLLRVRVAVVAPVVLVAVIIIVINAVSEGCARASPRGVDGSSTGQAERSQLTRRRA